MDCVWHSGAWIDVLHLPIPADVPEPEHRDYRLQLEAYVECCAMVLEDWDQRDAQGLGDFRWGWVDYERQLAYLCLEVEGFPDLRLFAWLNDFAFAGSRTIHVLAVNENGRTYLQGPGIVLLQRRRDDVIAQLTARES
jgi:hypothetical protein